tara:strand:+ start:4822 stop:5733 length:912 start_codon:yes stop_codon:yes gene_type:complete
MRYKKGYKIKPLRSEGGVMIFTDGTTEMMPSQASCEAYGYKWDEANGTCVITNTTSVDINAKINNGYNNVLGKKNDIGSGVENSIIAGERNVFEGQTRNVIVNGNDNLVRTGVFNSSIVSGDRNILGNDVNNSSILSGEGAVSIRDNETVLGGFYTDGLLRGSETKPFTCQSSQFMMQLSLNDTSTLTSLNVANGNDFINVNANSFIDFTAECMVTGDNLSKFSSGILTGKVSVGSNGVAALQVQSYTHKANSGSNPFGNHIFYLSASTDGIKIKTQGISSERVIFTASVKITEVIHDSSIIL